MTLKVNSFLLSIYCFIGYSVYCAEYEDEYGPDYGESWIMFVDENGTSHVVNFTTIPTDTRNMLFGDSYFYMYTRRNQEREELIIDEGKISSIFFNSSNDIKIVTHGWLNSDATEWLQRMKSSLLEKGDFNVITVDWGELAQNPAYPYSAFSTRYVGKRVAQLLSSLDNSYDIQDRNIHLIGHSLGAQVMGYAGMFSEFKVHRITGLDPARPLFEIPLMGKNYRLEKSDAMFVDIIHTCGGIYGYKNSHGDADFYPNSGKPFQPGCEGLRSSIEACSHGYAYEFFDESINSGTPFTSYPCGSWKEFENGECKINSTSMGYPVSLDSKGDYYLYTRGESKYAISDCTD